MPSRYSPPLPIILAARVVLSARHHTIRHHHFDLHTFPKPELDALARLLGALVGRLHVRGATKLPTRGWSRADRLYVLDSAVRLAGVHEAAYLAFCRLRSGR